jgi:hypothetical protein
MRTCSQLEVKMPGETRGGVGCHLGVISARLFAATCVHACSERSLQSVHWDSTRRCMEVGQASGPFCIQIAYIATGAQSEAFQHDSLGLGYVAVRGLGQPV